MNKLINFILITVISGFLISCQKDYNPYEVPEDQKDQINNFQGQFKCNIAGDDFASEFQQAYVNYVEGTGFKTLSINGTKYDDERLPENYRSITLNIAVYEGPNRYAVTYPATATMSIVHKDYGTMNYFSKYGDEEQYVEITEDNGNFVKGTFRVKIHLNPGTDEEFVELLDGEFNVPIMNR